LIREREAGFVLVALLCACVLAFGGFLSGPWALLAAFLAFPSLVWAGTRLGPRGAVVASAATAVAAVWGTARGHGPFVAEGTHASLMLLWAYAITMGTAALTLAAAISQRERAEEGHRVEAAGRLRMEQKLNQAQRLEGLGLLAGGVAHDLNNILTVIVGNANLMKAELRGDQPSSERLEKIELATERAAELCRRLLSYAGRRRPEVRRLLLSDLIGETCLLVSGSIPKRVALTTSAFADAPAVDGDAVLLRQVLMNLVINAAEAIGDGPGLIAIEAKRAVLDAEEIAQMSSAEKASPGHFGLLEVRDDGAGMNAETRSRVFDPFYSTKGEGRGLGLASVLGIVASHEGALDLQSTPGGGTTIRVYLPASREPGPPRESRQRSKGSPAAGQLVLVADDEPEVRAVVIAALEATGYRTIAAADGREAVERFCANPKQIAALVLDVTMPGMTGPEALAEIRGVDSDVPAILMTGYELGGPVGRSRRARSSTSPSRTKISCTSWSARSPRHPVEERTPRRRAPPSGRREGFARYSTTTMCPRMSPRGSPSPTSLMSSLLS
jgi:signal transduction histidine kinase